MCVERNEGGSERREQASIKHLCAEQFYTPPSSPSCLILPTSPRPISLTLSFSLLHSAIYLLCDLGVDHLVYLCPFPSSTMGKKIVQLL